MSDIEDDQGSLPDETEAEQQQQYQPPTIRIDYSKPPPKFETPAHAAEFYTELCRHFELGFVRSDIIHDPRLVWRRFNKRIPQEADLQLMLNGFRAFGAFKSAEHHCIRIAVKLEWIDVNQIATTLDPVFGNLPVLVLTEEGKVALAGGSWRPMTGNHRRLTITVIMKDSRETKERLEAKTDKKKTLDEAQQQELDIALRWIRELSEWPIHLYNECEPSSNQTEREI